MTDGAARRHAMTVMSARAPRMTRTLALVYLLGCSSCAPHAVPPREPQPTAPLLRAAQEALDKGVRAASLPDYPLAIRLFAEARRLAPDAALVYFNLGLAESHVPTRELRAIAWFGAYLAAYPEAPNAAVVRANIDVLEQQNRRNIVRLIDAERNAVVAIGDESQYGRAMEEIAALYVSAGNSAGVETIWKQVPAERKLVAARMAEALQVRAASQVDSGDADGARKTLAEVPPIIELIDNYYEELRANLGLAETRLKANDVVGANATLSLANKIVLTRFARDNDQTRSAALTSIAVMQCKARDLSGALETLRVAQQAARHVQDRSDMAWTLKDIAIAHAGCGDIDAAQRIVEFLEPDWMRRRPEVAIVEAQLKAGDFLAARTTAGTHVTALLLIAEAEVAAGDIRAAQEIIQSARRAADREDGPWRYGSLIEVADAQRTAGDLGAAARTLASAKHLADRIPWNKEVGLRTEGSNRHEAQSQVAAAEARLQAARFPAAAWLAILDGTLDTPPFLDLARHLDSLPVGNDLSDTLGPVVDTTKTMLEASSSIRQMLDAQRREVAQAPHLEAAER